MCEKRCKYCELDGQFQRCFGRIEREGMSAMSLSLPATWMVAMGDAYRMRCRSASARTSRAPMRDLGDIRVAHEHAGVLSHLVKADIW